jgi:predicted dinucleotide-binding enzyme
MSAEHRMRRIGIIGPGDLGQAFARTAQRPDRHVAIANSPGPRRCLWPRPSAPGVSPDTIGEAPSSAMVAVFDTRIFVRGDDGVSGALGHAGSPR